MFRGDLPRHATLAGMSYRIGDHELDARTYELRFAGQAVAVEPQVLALLFFFAENRDRLITKDEIVEAVWKGRIVSDSAITSRIKSARQALGDDGAQQRTIRTIHGKGYRFVAEVTRAPASAGEAAAAPDAPAEAAPAKPSIAVLPFHLIGTDPRGMLLSEALPHEITTELSRLRWLFVIARGSAFQFRGPMPDVRHIGTVLGVRYCLSGSIAVDDRQMELTVELSDTRDGGVVWADHYSSNIASIHEVRSQIVAYVSTALEIQIPLREAQQARLKAPNDLDAWSAYHLGLQHMFRFNRQDNAVALTLFETAVAKESDFARAHAGLSFTHFQNAFLGHVPDVGAARAAARAAAERAVDIDALDPFANFTYGRSLWLEDNVSGSLVWLDRSILLSPNYAQGIYAKAWAETLLGNGADGQQHADAAMALSPIDPLRYAMLATRALAHLVRDETAAAAGWSDQAARAPGAHILITLIAAACHALNGDMECARLWAARAKERDPGICQQRFFRSFPFEDAQMRQRIAGALKSVDI